MISKLSIAGLLALMACLKSGCAVRSEQTSYLLTPQQQTPSRQIVRPSVSPNAPTMSILLERAPQASSLPEKISEETPLTPPLPRGRVATTGVSRLAPQRTSLQVYTTIPVPTRYAPARVSGNVVIPATPTQFEQRKVGTEQGVSPDGRTSLSSTRLEGFINYGSPIRVPVAGPGGQIQIREIPNTIVQPVFQTIRVSH